MCVCDDRVGVLYSIIELVVVPPLLVWSGYGGGINHGVYNNQYSRAMGGVSG